MGERLRPGRVTKWLGGRLRGDVSRGTRSGVIPLRWACAPLASATIKDSEIAPQPKFVKSRHKKPAAGTRVNVVADKLTYDANTKIATATGLVEITYGPYTLTATHVTYDTDHDIFTANGSIVLHEPNGNVLEADTADHHRQVQGRLRRSCHGAPHQRCDDHRPSMPGALSATSPSTSTRPTLPARNASSPAERPPGR